MSIVHRRLNQPKSGRRLLLHRRLVEQSRDSDRRSGSERRIVPDRRQAQH